MTSPLHFAEPQYQCPCTVCTNLRIRKHNNRPDAKVSKKDLEKVDDIEIATV